MCVVRVVEKSKQDNSFSHEPNLANIRHIRGYCRMGAYIREFIEILAVTQNI